MNDRKIAIHCITFEQVENVLKKIGKYIHIKHMDFDIYKSETCIKIQIGGIGWDWNSKRFYENTDHAIISAKQFFEDYYSFNDIVEITHTHNNYKKGETKIIIGFNSLTKLKVSESSGCIVHHNKIKLVSSSITTNNRKEVKEMSNVIISEVIFNHDWKNSKEDMQLVQKHFHSIIPDNIIGKHYLEDHGADVLEAAKKLEDDEKNNR